MRVKVDQDLCVGSGDCEERCPDIFKVVDRKSQVQTDPVPKGVEGCVRDALNGCPARAISIT